jgi:hypothetical protein
MYKLSPKLWNGSPATSVIRLLDGAVIPFSEANTDYQEYLKFLAEGGQPLPADDNGQTPE